MYGFNLSQAAIELLDVSIQGLDDNITSKQLEEFVTKCDEIEFKAYSLLYETLAKAVKEYAKSLEDLIFSVDATQLRSSLASSDWKKTKAENFLSKGKLDEVIDLLKEAVDELQSKYLEWKASEKNRKRKAKLEHIGTILVVWIGTITLFFTISSSILKINPFELKHLITLGMVLFFEFVLTIGFLQLPKD